MPRRRRQQPGAPALGAGPQRIARRRRGARRAPAESSIALFQGRARSEGQTRGRRHRLGQDDRRRPAVRRRAVSDGLRQRGLHARRAGGDRDYYAPDEARAPRSSFADTHCLRVIAADAAHVGDVGIGFDPVDAGARHARRDTWHCLAQREDASTSAHSTSTTRTSSQSRTAAAASITFQSMPSGVPMIDRWTIHSPIIATDESEMSSGDSAAPAAATRATPLPRTRLSGARRRARQVDVARRYELATASRLGHGTCRGSARARRARRARVAERHGRHRRDGYRAACSACRVR